MKKMRGLVVFALLILLSTVSTSLANGINTTESSNLQISRNRDSSEISLNFEKLLAQEPFGESSTVPLILKSSNKTLQITPLEFDTVKKSPNVDMSERYLLNFSYIEEYIISAHQEDTTGIAQYNVNETIGIAFYAFFPVVLEIYHNSTVSTDSLSYITSRLYTDPNYKAKIGFTVSFTLEYFFLANLGLIKPTVGPDAYTISFDYHWEFDTPLDGKLIGKKYTRPLLSIPQPTPVLQVGIGVQPKIDTDISAKLDIDNKDLSLSTDSLQWYRNNTIQSFSVFVPEFYTKNNLLINIFKFDMSFTLSLQFFLDITVTAIKIFKKTFSFPIFAIPIKTLHLPLPEEANIPLSMNVTPSGKIPVVYGVDYALSDTAGDNDGLIEPGEKIDLELLIVNLGEGSAINVNTTIVSDNVTIYGADSVPLLLKNREAYALQSGFYFTVPSDYTADFIIATATFTYLALNGTVYYSTYDFYLRVVDPSDTYLEVSNLIVDYPGSYWKAGDNIDIYFNVTNRGARDINYAQILFSAGLDTDTVNPVTVVSDTTNTTSLAVGESAILGSITLSSDIQHDDGLVYLYLDVYYEDNEYGYFDPYCPVIPIYVPKPDFTVVSTLGIDQDLDGKFEAGESLLIEFNIQNIGEGTGYNIAGYVTSDNPDLNITYPEVSFNDLAPNEEGGSTFARIDIPITARNQTAIFTLHLTAEDSKGHVLYWTFNISLEIIEKPSPIIELKYYSIDDNLYGDGDGVPEPGETFLLYVYTMVNNTGLNIIGTANSSDLIFYNDTCNYGDLTDELSSGEGYWVYVPLDYHGGETYINLNISAESYSGRKVYDTAYIVLDIPAGDLTPPEITLEQDVPSQIYVNEPLIVNVTITDPLVTGELQTGVAKIVLFYTFNDGEIIMVELYGSDGTYSAIFDTSQAGSYEFIIAAVDNAGNIDFLPQSDAFKVDIVEKQTETTQTTETSQSTETTQETTTPQTTEKSSYALVMSILPLLCVFTIRFIRRKKRTKGKE
ncbi:MAG: hypothetical protein ACTSYD_14475 [Candidatus Heimdallarchaeaceae archaeon]